jgi:serine/threonine-protein kinase
MRADVLRAVAGRPVLATPVMREDEHPAMMAPTMVRSGPPTRSVARVADRPQRRNSVPIAIALTLLGVLAVAALAAGLYLARTPTTTVPGLDGKTQAQAEQILTEAKLKSSPNPTQIANCQPNSVINQSQQPKQGERVKEGSTVSYQVCIGPGQTTVPQLVGLSKDRAKVALDQAHLQASFVTVDSAEVANQVVDSNPKEGATVAQGSTVVVSLSLGNEAPMPDLSGLTRAGAEQKLNQSGFRNVKFGTIDVNDPDKVGKVVSQSVPANTPWKKDQQINVIIGQANAPTTPPVSPSHS